MALLLSPISTASTFLMDLENSLSDQTKIAVKLPMLEVEVLLLTLTLRVLCHQSCDWLINMSNKFINSTNIGTHLAAGPKPCSTRPYQPWASAVCRPIALVAMDHCSCITKQSSISVHLLCSGSYMLPPADDWERMIPRNFTSDMLFQPNNAYIGKVELRYLQGGSTRTPEVGHQGSESHVRIYT